MNDTNLNNTLNFSDKDSFQYKGHIIDGCAMGMPVYPATNLSNT